MCPVADRCESALTLSKPLDVINAAPDIECECSARKLLVFLSRTGKGHRHMHSGFRVHSSRGGFRVQGSGCRVQGSGFRVQERIESFELRSSFADPARRGTGEYH